MRDKLKMSDFALVKLTKIVSKYILLAVDQSNLQPAGSRGSVSGSTGPFQDSVTAADSEVFSSVYEPPASQSPSLIYPPSPDRYSTANASFYDSMGSLPRLVNADSRTTWDYETSGEREQWVVLPLPWLVNSYKALSVIGQLIQSFVCDWLVRDCP